VTVNAQGAGMPPAALPVRKVGRPCSICSRDDRAAIDAALIAGAAPDAISKKFDIGKQAVARHRAHIPLPAQATAIAEHEAELGAQGIDLLQSADELRLEALRVLRAAQADNQRDVELRAIREAARLLDLMGKLRGDLSNDTTINILAAPVMIELNQIVLTALTPWPEARAAVVQALGSISGPALIEHSA
jgi:hypothetical protein